MTVSEARASLPKVVARVLAGEDVTLTRHGQPVAVIVRPDRLRVRRTGDTLAAATSVKDALEQGRNSPLRSRPTLSKRRADALVTDVVASR